MFKRELRAFRPWIIGAICWLCLSLVVSQAHLRSERPDYLFELGGLMSLIWLQFSFAGLFHTLRREHGRRVVGFLLLAVVPPSVLYFINALLLW